jgi:hypothetical protein
MYVYTFALSIYVYLPIYTIYALRLIYNVTPDFPKKTKCIPVCMPGSSFMHIVT